MGYDHVVETTVNVGVVPTAGDLTAKVPLESGVAPLLAEPIVVTHADAINYLSTLRDLETCLDKDARATLVYQSPGKMGAAAQNKVIEAAALDGCHDYYFKCPDPDQPPTPTSLDEGQKRIQAYQLRNDAAVEYSIQEAMTKRAKDRGLNDDAAGNAQVQKELDFYTDLRTLADDIDSTTSATISETVTSSADWRAIQALDVRYQALRARYVALGFQPSCAVPNFTTNTPWGWLIPAVIVVGVVIGGVVVLRGSM